MSNKPLGPVSLTLLALVVQALRTISTVLNKIAPESLRSEDLNELLMEIQTADTEIMVYKRRAALALEINKQPKPTKR